MELFSVIDNRNGYYRHKTVLAPLWPDATRTGHWTQPTSRRQRVSVNAAKWNLHFRYSTDYYRVSCVGIEKSNPFHVLVHSGDEKAATAQKKVTKHCCNSIRLGNYSRLRKSGFLNNWQSKFSYSAGCGWVGIPWKPFLIAIRERSIPVIIRRERERER